MMLLPGELVVVTPLPMLTKKLTILFGKPITKRDLVRIVPKLLHEASKYDESESKSEKQAGRFLLRSEADKCDASACCGSTSSHADNKIENLTFTFVWENNNKTGFHENCSKIASCMACIALVVK